jgi:sugar phosphate isomerase/epimerase
MIDGVMGLSHGCFYQTPLVECLETIRDMGFRMLEIGSFPAHLEYHDPAAVRRTANRRTALGLEPYAFHAPFAAHLDITALDAGQRDHTLQEFLRFAGQTTDLLWLLDALKPVEVEMCLDTGHAHLAGDLHTLVPQCASHLRLALCA